MTYSEYQESHFPGVASGTFAAQQLLARWERDEELQTARVHEFPLITQFYCCGSGAVRYALNLLSQSRSNADINPKSFVSSFVRLEAYLDGLTPIENASRAFRDWPKEPGFVFGGKAGWSVLEASIAFAKSIHNGTVVARALHRTPIHGEPYASQQVGDECGPDIIQWCGKTREELSTHTCPATHVWPSTAELHSAIQSIGFKIADEYDRAVKASKANVARHLLVDTLEDCAEAIGRYSSLRPRLFEELVLVHQQTDGPWSIRYKRDPSKGLPNIKPKTMHHVTSEFSVEGLSLETGILSVQMPETYAPFHDFEFLDGTGRNPRDGTESSRIAMRMQLVLQELLDTAKKLLLNIQIIEQEVSRRGLKSDASSLSILAEEFPVFPYWTPPRGKQLKEMGREDFDAILIKERPLLDNARLSTRLLLNEENLRLEKAEHGQITSPSFADDLTAVEQAQSSSAKGKALEVLMRNLLSTVDGFHIYECNVNTETEEIDIVVDNRCNMYPWNREPPVVLVECKNWSKPADKNSIVSLKEKINNRRGRCSVGIFVGWSGFTSKADLELLRTSQENWIILQLDGPAVKQAAATGDFAATLEQAWRAAILK